MADPPPAAAPQARGEGALSPLSGSYLLIVVGAPHHDHHKDTILSRISKGQSHVPPQSVDNQCGGAGARPREAPADPALNQLAALLPGPASNPTHPRPNICRPSSATRCLSSYMCY